MKAKTGFKLAAAAGLVSLLVIACGGNSSTPAAPIVAAATTVTISPATATAATASLTAAPAGFSFPSGVATLGTTGATTVKFTPTADPAKPAFSVASPAFGYSGVVAYGSCIFTITSLTGTPPAPYVVGYSFTVTPCLATYGTAGVVTGGTVNVPFTLTLGAVPSTTSTVTVTAAVDGTISVGTTTVGKTTLLTGS